MNAERQTILFVDDERGPRESLRMVLKYDYNILLADRGRSGLEVLERDHVDLLVTGIRMPEMSGIELFTIVRQKYPDLPVLILTGYVTFETAVQCMELGAFDYMEKPFNVGELKEVVRHALAFPGRNNFVDTGGIAPEAAEAILNKWHSFKLTLLTKDDEKILTMLNEYDADQTLEALLKSGNREMFLERIMATIFSVPCGKTES
jgi:YesN/AraC family two-component response regulator